VRANSHQYVSYRLVNSDKLTVSEYDIREMKTVRKNTCNRKNSTLEQIANP